MDHSAQAGYTGSDYFNVFTVSRPLRALFFGFFFFKFQHHFFLD